MHTCLKKLTLIVFGIAAGCRQPADAHGLVAVDLMVATPVQTPVVAGRPPHMPCEIVIWKKQGNKDLPGRQSLYYDKRGRLSVATIRLSTPDCPDPGQGRCLGREVVALRYEYDDQGRFIRAIAPVDEDGTSESRLEIGYEAMGKPKGYTWTAPDASGHTNWTGLAVLFDALNHPTATLGHTEAVYKGQPWKVSLISVFSGTREPFASSPIVWPDDPGVLYFGWARHSLMLQAEGGTVVEGPVETVLFDEDGKLKSSSSQSEKKSSRRREFVYRCRFERPAEELVLLPQARVQPQRP